MVRKNLLLLISVTYFVFVSQSILSQELQQASSGSSTSIIQENFPNIENWENFGLSGNKNPTEYIIDEDSVTTCLKIISQNAASGLIHKNHFNPNMYPLLTWRWRVDNIIHEADGKTKSGDDYAIRLFVMFEDDSVETSTWTSLRNSAIKLIYSSAPPEASLCFIRVIIRYEEKYVDNPYLETVKILPMQLGDGQLKKWNKNTVNIVRLFKEVFGGSCPSSAKLAIMSDIDNTNSNTLAYFDFISVAKD